ncbi:MAG: thioredoxin family protein [Novosphingobium sp.]
MMLKLIAAALLALGAGQAAPTVPAPEAKAEVQSDKPRVLYYPVDADAAKVFDQALAKARGDNARAVIVFGADWCHDSRALGKLLTSDAFKSEFGSRFEVTFIDVGRPQTGEGRNLELVRKLGVKDLKSTPAMFVLRGDGKVLNGKKDAVSWRNAESRGTDKILAWFRDFKKS